MDNEVNELINWIIRELHQIAIALKNDEVDNLGGRSNKKLFKVLSALHLGLE